MYYAELKEGSLVVFTYTNWKGETSIRKAIILEFIWSQTEWHPEMQVLMSAYDLDKMEERKFAAKDISELKVIDINR